MSINANILLWVIAIPLIGGVLCLLIPNRWKGGKEALTLGATGAGLLISLYLFSMEELRFFASWLPFGFDIDLRLYHFSGLVLLGTSGFSFLVAVYSTVFMSGKYNLRLYYSYLLITASFSYGTVLSNNFMLLLFFWGALLLTLYGIISIGNRNSFRTATKSFIIVGVTDLCLVLGVMIAASMADTLTMDEVRLPVTGAAGAAFVLMMIGALGKAGAMPFHSWIPDAAIDAPLPVMAFLPASLEKLLGIYLLARICLDFFVISSGMGAVLLVVGSVTIVFAVAMALVQKDYKKLLSYHAISQVGYMVLGIGTGLPVGIAGGIFHMLNHSMYKCCLFLSGGAVEYGTGTTDLNVLGGLRRQMPITFACFAVAALSISGVPPFNGFFSKEMIFEAALHVENPVFFVAAQLGAILTFASFLKLGHSAYLGRRPDELSRVKESPPAMLIPMMALAFGCILFGVYNELPLKYLVEPVLPMEHEHFWGPIHWGNAVTVVSVFGLLIALSNHVYGFLKTGAGIGAVDHIHHAPVLSTVYSWAERRYFDPFDLGMRFNRFVSSLLYTIDRIINWTYDGFAVGIVYAFSDRMRRLHRGLLNEYLSWCLVGGGAIFVLMLWGK